MSAIDFKRQKVIVIFLGKVYTAVEETEKFTLMSRKETQDKTSETDNFSISIFSS